MEACLLVQIEFQTLSLFVSVLSALISLFTFFTSSSSPSVSCSSWTCTRSSSAFLYPSLHVLYNCSFVALLVHSQNNKATSRKRFGKIEPIRAIVKEHASHFLLLLFTLPPLKKKAIQ